MSDKIKFGKFEMTEDEFERQFLKAARRGEQKIASSPKAKKAYYQPRAKRLVVDLHNGVTVFIPIRLIQIFQNADEVAIADVEILLDGLSLRWKRLDEHLSVQNLISGIFGTKKWMDGLSAHLSEIGRRGGASKSEAKKNASRENGKKGGRPNSKVA